MNESVKCRECKEMILREEAVEYGKEFIWIELFSVKMKLNKTYISVWE